MLQKNILIYFLVLSALTSVSQESMQQDSIKTLNAEQVLELVRKFHPVARQGAINIEMSESDILIARSNFDPILSYYASGKTFDGIDYYNYTSPELKIPTWYGIELYGGAESLSGNRLDPTKTSGQSSYAGISIPLLKDLVIDKRRAFLQQAKIFNKSAAEQQRLIINNLLVDAAVAYWQWVKAYQTYLVVSDNVATNERRFNLIKNTYLNGERPAIDTVEAVAQLQSFKYQQNLYYFEFQNAGLELSTFLWKNNEEPYNLPESIIPQKGWENEINISNFNLSLSDLLLIADNNHPELKIYNYKLDALYIDKKLKFQELLPSVDLSYNQLSKGYRILESGTPLPLLENNFQYGLKVEIPLRLSMGRGSYKMAKLKIADTTLEQEIKRLQIQLKIKNYFNEFVNLKNQVALQSDNYQNYQKLVSAEETRFFNGESSLFLINARENKALEELEKLIELKTKYYKTIYSLQWSAGLLK
jgi:outer membrane protein TolC